jgi:hypothetical protein
MSTSTSTTAETETNKESGQTEEERLSEFPDDIRDIKGCYEMCERMAEAESVRDWSFILSDYISFGNTKLTDGIAIFNMNSATDCPNIGTDNCQVPKEDCYAFKAENLYKQPLPYRRRQEVLWDCMPPELFAEAFLELVSRKRKEVTAIRFSEAGDFRHEGDIIRVNRIAELVAEEGIDVYTYSASNYLNWDLAEEFFVNASNDIEVYGDQRYIAVPEEEDIPEDGIHCPYEATDGEIKCGDCRLCITGSTEDVYITFH